MRKAQKKQIEELMTLLKQAHEEICDFVEKNEYANAMDMLGQCQESAVQIGELIEKTEGEDIPTIAKLEAYCEQIYEIYEALSAGTEVNVERFREELSKTLIQAENSVKNDIRVRLEIVFLPYKASMWDSLESVWRAADEDPDCDAYVVPIPYYDKNRDGSFGAYHYEGDKLPADVPVTYYTTYALEERCPDVVFIHNPYDQYNNVTSVHPRFYSQELKKSTECLVYIPYYATSGAMSEAQGFLPSYFVADYIVIQSDKFRKYFDKDLADEKFLTFGSPKFDSAIQKCQNPPEPPADWKEKMAGKKVYFYNTSINGMLANTDAFLRKMKYVFDIFLGRKDACLLWRAHPLLESTFESMRREYKPIYDALKVWFVEANIGILDETSDMENTIALSDIYIGDAATSVTSLFGVAGKPLFILNNSIHTLPEKDDWRGERINLQYNGWGDDRYQVTANNQLWFSEKNDYHYRYYMDLETGYTGNWYYLRAMELKGKLYVAPRYAQDILCIENSRIRKIALNKYNVPGTAFWNCWYDDDRKYLFLFPDRYPYLVRYCLDTGKIDYIDGIQPFYVRMVDGGWEIGGTTFYENELWFASPEDNRILCLDIDTLDARIIDLPCENYKGTQSFSRRWPDGEDFWLLPRKGLTIIRWNPKTGAVREYNSVPEQFRVTRWPFEYEADEHPFASITFFEEENRKAMIITPNWGNMFLLLDEESGKTEEWELPMGSSNRGKNEYFLTSGMGSFVITREQIGKADCRIWYAPERKLYDFNVFTREYSEVEIEFDYQDLLAHEAGFSEDSEWMQYCACENAFNSLKDLLDDDITGKPFDRERQLRDFAKINANMEGTCGQNVYAFAKGKIV